MKVSNLKISCANPKNPFRISVPVPITTYPITTAILNFKDQKFDCSSTTCTCSPKELKVLSPSEPDSEPLLPKFLTLRAANHNQISFLLFFCTPRDHGPDVRTLRAPVE